MANIHKLLEAFSTDDLIDEVRRRDCVVAVKVWTMEDLENQAEAYLREDRGTELADEEWDAMLEEMREDSGQLKPDLEDCRNEEWDAIDSFVKAYADKYAEAHLKKAPEARKARKGRNEKRDGKA